MTNTPKTVLTIAGSDSSGGAGISADLKTFTEYGIYGIPSLTAIATMNVQKQWQHEVFLIDEEVIQKQLNTAFAIKNLDTVKTGMLPNESIIKLVADNLNQHKPANIVIDPVIACKGDNQVVNHKVIEAFQKYLLPIATVTTPNLLEAKLLSSMKEINTLADMKEAAQIIRGYGADNVVIKGGTEFHSGKAIDLLFDGEDFIVFEKNIIQNASNHGAGCTFAAAITAGIANGNTPAKAIDHAKDFVTTAILNGIELNDYSKPVYHSAMRIYDVF